MKRASKKIVGIPAIVFLIVAAGIVGGGLLLSVHMVSAQTGGTTGSLGAGGDGPNYTKNGITLTNPLSTSNLSDVITNIINFLVTDIAIPLTTIMVLVGAFQLMTAAGNPEKESRGRKTVMYAAIGFAVALLATGVAQLIENIIGTSS